MSRIENGFRTLVPTRYSGLYIVGFSISLLFLVGLPARAAGDGLFRTPPWGVALGAVVVVIVGYLVGMSFVRTIGIAAFGVQIGGAVAVIICAGRGEWVYAAAFLAWFAAGWFVQVRQQARLESEDRFRR